MLRHFIPRNDGRIFAFTLAEVLITLVVIGVIAALTIPNLMKNYQNHVQVVALKRAMHNLQTYVNRLKTDTDCVGNDLICTGYFNDKSQWDWLGSGFKDKRAFMNHLFKGYINNNYPYNVGYRMHLDYKCFNGTRNCNYMEAIGSGYYLMPDGILYGVSSDQRNQVVIVYVDTNGFKGPNQIGRDEFRLLIDISGKVITTKPTWAGYPCTTSPSGDNGWCAANYIATHGWKIDY